LAAGGGRAKSAGAGGSEEQQQSKKHSGTKQRQGIAKGASADGTTVSKRQSSADQPSARSAHEPCTETADRRSKQQQQQQQQPVSCQVGSALSNTVAFLLLSQVNWTSGLILLQGSDSPHLCPLWSQERKAPWS
jgi:hypothetical protein